LLHFISLRKSTYRVIKSRRMGWAGHVGINTIFRSKNLKGRELDIDRRIFLKRMREYGLDSSRPRYRPVANLVNKVLSLRVP